MALSLSQGVSLSVPLGLTSPTQIRAGDWPVSLPRDFWDFSGAHSVIGRPCHQPIKPLCPVVLL